MGSVRRAAVVDLTPEQAFELWTDVSRWPTFVDGFSRVDRIDPEWPAPGAKVVWQSVPTGRGTVTERVTTNEPGRRFATQYFEQRAIGTQTVELAPTEDGATQIALELDYKPQTGGPIGRITDVLFIRRAQGDALARTLRRFAIEAAEQAAL
jgi:ribosome-associated toxin RatA of RatAB toxin-antitoxin module